MSTPQGIELLHLLQCLAAYVQRKLAWDSADM